MATRTTLTITPRGGTPRIVTDYAKWETAKLIYTVSEDQLSYVCEIRDIILLAPVANMFITPEALVFDVVLEVYEPPRVLTFTGVISLEDVEFVEKDICKISIRLDNLDELLARISAFLVKPTTTTLVLREPQKDATAVGIVALFLALAFSLVSFAYTFVQNRLIATALVGTGFGGPATGPLYFTVSYLLLFIYLAIFIVALVRAIQELKRYLDSIRVRANVFNLYDAMIQIANAAGYNLDLNSIQGVRDVYIVTPPNAAAGGTTTVGTELITASEIIDAIKKTLNARVYVFNNTIRFAYIQDPSVPPEYQTALIERTSYDTSEIQNIFIFSLVRDPAEGYSFFATPAAFERIIPNALGYKKVALGYAPHRIKSFETFVDRAVQGLLLTLFILTAGLGFIVFVILRALNVIRNYDPKRGHIIVEGEGWSPKIIECDNIEQPGTASEGRYLRSVAQRYRSRLLRKYTTKVRMTFAQLYDLFQAGFPSTRSLTYYILDEYAEVVYVEEINYPINVTERFV